MSKTADDLLRFVKRRITVPANQVLLSDSDMLELADNVMLDTIVPLVLSTRQNYYLYVTSTTVTAGTATYRLPKRAIGRALRDIKYSTDGTDTNAAIRDLSQCEIEDVQNYADDGDPVACCFIGDRIKLIPTPESDEQAIIWYWDCQPGKLVKLASCARITGVTDDDVTVSSLPSTMTTSTALDLIEKTSGHTTLAFELTPSAINGTVISFATDAVPDDLAVGDYVALEGYSPYVQAPDECFPLLETKTAERILSAIGDSEGLARLKEDEAQQDQNLKKLLEPRLRGEPKKIMNRNGLIRGRVGRGTFGNRRLFF